MNLMSRWAKIDTHFYRLIHLFRCQQGDSLDPECSADVADEGNGSGSDIVGQIDDDVEVLLTEGEVEGFQSSADAAQGLFGCFASFGTSLFEKTFVAFLGIRTMEKIFRHLAPPLIAIYCPWFDPITIEN